MSALPSYYVDEPSTGTTVCPRCKGSGVDPACAKSFQDDEWDCPECWGEGAI